MYGFEALQSRQDRDAIAKTIETIVTNAKENRIDEGSVAFSLSYGSKALSLLYSETHGNSGTHVGNKGSGERLPNETTLLYIAAREILSSLAGRRKEPIQYELVTRNLEMLAWARTTGDQLFHWKSAESFDMSNEDGSTGTGGIFQTEILPKIQG